MGWPVDKASRNGRPLAGLLTSTMCAVGSNGTAVSGWAGDATMTSVKSVGGGGVLAKREDGGEHVRCSCHDLYVQSNFNL